jgi:hypothetical protein
MLLFKRLFKRGTREVWIERGTTNEGTTEYLCYERGVGHTGHESVTAFLSFFESVRFCYDMCGESTISTGDFFAGQLNSDEIEIATIGALLGSRDRRLVSAEAAIRPIFYRQAHSWTGRDVELSIHRLRGGKYLLRSEGEISWGVELDSFAGALQEFLGAYGWPPENSGLPAGGVGAITIRECTLLNRRELADVRRLEKAWSQS